MKVVKELRNTWSRVGRSWVDEVNFSWCDSVSCDDDLLGRLRSDSHRRGLLVPREQIPAFT